MPVAFRAIETILRSAKAIGVAAYQTLAISVKYCTVVSRRRVHGMSGVVEKPNRHCDRSAKRLLWHCRS